MISYAMLLLILLSLLTFAARRLLTYLHLFQQALRYAPRNEGHGGSLACQAHGNFTADAAVAGAGDDSHFAGEARRLWYVFYGFGG